jgi:hypothetical protein
MVELIDDESLIKPVIEEGANGQKACYIEGVFMQAGIKNKNGRIYPVEIMQQEVERYIKEKVEQNRAYGELNHPTSPTINLDRVSHLIKEIRQDGNNYIGRAKILESTPMGRIARSLIDEGCKLGVSSRGVGTVKLRNGINEVQNDFRLSTAADIVADPSAPAAFVQGVMEGAEWIYENGNFRMIEQIRADIERAHSSVRIDESYALSAFEKFLASIGKPPIR